MSMNMRVHHIFLLFAVPVFYTLFGCKDSDSSPANSAKTTKIERNSIKDGNEAFGQGNFRKALDLYDDAISSSPASEAARFNKAVALVKLSGGRDSSMIAEATQIYDNLGETAADASIKEKANYNLGNLAFYENEFDKSIEFYKRALRINPNNMKTRENLRVAQLKRHDDNQQQNQQDQQQQQQEQEQQQQQQDQPQQQQQEQPQPDTNADQILQSMQNRENQTRKQAEKKESNSRRSYSDKPW